MKKTLLFAATMMAACVAMAQDDLGYTPIEGEYQVTIPNCSGTYVNNGFSISLYGVEVDEQGFVAGAGDVVNLEFYTESPSSENFSIAGEYNYYDTQAWMDKTTSVKYGPGDLMGGFLYEMMPGFVMPMGTMVTIYGDDNDETLGLAGPGSKLTITAKGDGVYNLAIDIYTPQNAHITGEWEGVLKDVVTNCPEEAGVGKTFAGDGKAEYYNLQGVKVDNPVKGQIYIQRLNGTTSKVVK